VSLNGSSLGFTVGDSRLLADVDIEVTGLTALVGPNGAGKSTLIRLLAGVQAPTTGAVTYDGATLLRRERARTIALVEQDATTELALTVREVVALGRIPHAGLLGPIDTTTVDAALTRTGLTPLATRQFASLSGGERQRVHLARALAQEPRVLLLDEPTNHLDVAAQLHTLDLLRAEAAAGTAVLAALHDLNLAASWATTVVMLHKGRVVAEGRPEDVLTAERISAVYGVTATVVAHPITERPLIAYSAGSHPSPAAVEPGAYSAG
jgi:iron complex transport system ATP-binding protein